MDDVLAFYGTPGPMTRLGTLPPLDLPTDLDGLRTLVPGLLVHRDWGSAYGLGADDLRLGEQNLRSVDEVLRRALELCDEPLTVARPPIRRVLCICCHFALVYVALLRSRGIPARSRCGFSNYFDPAKWYDHWIAERWEGGRWVRDDPQIDDVQRRLVDLDFDPYDQPPGKFLTGSEAWAAARSGDVDPDLFGIFDMWGLRYISGNVITDFAAINKVELLPWDSWGMMTGPHEPLDAAALVLFDELAQLVNQDDVQAIRHRYESDDRLRVPPAIRSIVDDVPVEVRLEL